MRGDDIAARLLGFATVNVHILGRIPKSVVATHVVKQLLRCSTSGGANYQEARSAESRTDFAHKVLVAAKEVGETVFWLELLESAGISRDPRIRPAIREGNELVAILKASAKTARANALTAETRR